MKKEKTKPKYSVIKAIKGQITPEKRSRILNEYKRCCDFLGVSPYLDKIIK